MITKRILLAIILVPLAILLIAFIMANRQMVILTINPFRINSENFTYQAPLFIWLFVFFSLGVLLSGIISWFTCMKCKKALKESKAELEKLKKSISNIKIL
ncbi:LapA family protein [Bartonella sp. CB189]|uniref:LapA family protein n=1 Tax=Bartonella sp. CB189 TaxID=3112254 RepID=UPI002F96B750